MGSLANDCAQHEVTESTQVRQRSSNGICWMHSSSVHRLLDFFRDFIALQRDVSNPLRNNRCTIQYRDFDIRLSALGSERTSMIHSIVVSIVVCNTDTRRKQVYTLMTKVMRINTGLRDMKICRCGGEIVVFRSIDASLLHLSDGMEFNLRLCDFLAHAARIAAELSSSPHNSVTWPYSWFGSIDCWTRLRLQTRTQRILLVNLRCQASSKNSCFSCMEKGSTDRLFYALATTNKNKMRLRVNLQLHVSSKNSCVTCIEKDPTLKSASHGNFQGGGRASTRVVLWRAQLLHCWPDEEGLSSQQEWPGTMSSLLWLQAQLM